jgi:N-hydroxyarylamine O-acetyltransferase
MKTEINLDAYTDRIGYEGSLTAIPDVLKQLHLLHPKSIPFENLNPFLGIPVLLDTESLQKKLVYDGRGGYCFEQNLFFKQVLETLGFRVKGLAARILWNRPDDEITPKGHMLLLVETEGQRYICDVGFGGLGPTAPLNLEPDLTQETPHETFKLEESDGVYLLRSHVQGEWKALYRFTLEEHYRQDYEITNWYLSNHPESHFVIGLVAARPEVNPNRRYNFRGNELSIHNIDGGTEKQVLETVSEIRQTLEDVFLIRLPEVPELDQKLDKLIKKAEAE